MNILKENDDLMRGMDRDFYQHVLTDPPVFSDILTTWTEHGLTIRNDQGICCYASSRYSKEKEFLWNLHAIAQDTEYLLFIGPISEETIKSLRMVLKKLYAIFLVEPSNQIFQATLQKENIRDIAKSGGRIKVHFFCNEPVQSIVKPIVDLAGNGAKIELLCSVSYQTLFPVYCHDLMTGIMEELRIRASLVITSILMRKTFFEHTIRNYRLPAMNGKHLKSILNGKPAIIVGAGPSLKKNIHLLRDAEDKAVIFACGSSLPTLREFGIRPHFNVIYEAGNNSLFTGGESFSDIPLIFANQVNPKSLAAYCGPKINIITDTDDFTRYYFSEPDMPTIRSGPSVANVAHDFICQMGCSPVIFIGQDMCMYNHELHAIDEKLIMGKEYTYQADFKTMDIYGNEVEALTKYWIIKSFIENINRQYPETVFINATEGGVGIEAVRNDTLENVLRTLSVQERPIRTMIAELMATSQSDEISRLERLKKLGFDDDLERIFSTAKKILNYIEEIENIDKNNVNSSKKKQMITRIEYQYKKMTESKFYQGIVDPYYGEIIKNIQVRYLRDCESNQIEKKIDAVTQKYRKIMYELIRFYMEFKDCYQAELNHDDIEKNELENQDGSHETI